MFKSNDSYFAHLAELDWLRTKNSVVSRNLFVSPKIDKQLFD